MILHSPMPIITLVYYISEKKEFDKALENATKAISLEKGNWKIIYNKGNILAQKEQYKDAVKYYEKALSIVKKRIQNMDEVGFYPQQTWQQGKKRYTSMSK